MSRDRGCDEQSHPGSGLAASYRNSPSARVTIESNGQNFLQSGLCATMEALAQPHLFPNG